MFFTNKSHLQPTTMHSIDEKAAYKRELAIDRLRNYIIDWRAGFRRQHGRGADDADIIGQPIDEVYQKYIELKRQRKLLHPDQSSSTRTEETNQTLSATKRTRGKYAANSQDDENENESPGQKNKKIKPMMKTKPIKKIEVEQPEELSEEQFEEQKRNLERVYNLFRRRPTAALTAEEEEEKKKEEKEESIKKTTKFMEPNPNSNRSVEVKKPHTRHKIKPAPSDADLPQSVKDFMVMMLGPQDPCVVQHRSSDVKEKSPFFQDQSQRDRILKEIEEGTFGMPKQPIIPKTVKELDEDEDDTQANIDTIDERPSYKKKPIQKRQTKLHKMKAVEDTSVEPDTKKSKRQEKARQKAEEEKLVKGRLLKILSQTRVDVCAKVDACTKESDHSIQPMLDQFMNQDKDVQP
ncbi:hypothetical protein F4703DRAFT_1877483 [Phycomyces blakesleeanus]